MLDVAGIMFSTIMVLMVVIRAIRLDRVQSWFGLPSREKSETTASGGPTAKHPPSNTAP
jgi:hypothetical protein